MAEVPMRLGKCSIAVKISPFIKDAMEKEMLTLHGLWTDIGKGDLEHYIEGQGFILI